MFWHRILLSAILVLFLNSLLKAVNNEDKWIDKHTSFKVVRLSRIDGNNTGLYFHQKAFTESGDKMIFRGDYGYYSVDMNSLKVTQLTDKTKTAVVVAPKRREIFCYNNKENTVEKVNIDTLKVDTIAKLPWHVSGLTPFSIDVNENILAAAFSEGSEEYYKKPRSEWFISIFEAKLLNKLFTVDIDSGEIKVIHETNSWLGHVQFSPVDSNLIMFCHEGPWEKLQRIWLINKENGKLRKVHPSNVDGQVEKHWVGHEFWDPNGDEIWYDFRTPFVGGDYFLACTNIVTGHEFRYNLRNEWFSYHYNISHEGKLFAADGCGEEYPGSTSEGRWIYLFKRRGSELEPTKLVSLKNHDYTKCEPCVQFSPDDKWVVFTSNMSGSKQVYGVQIKAGEMENCSQINKTEIANLYTILNQKFSDQPQLSYLKQPQPDLDAWRDTGRAKLQELMSFDAPITPQNVRIIEKIQKDGYTRALLKYDIAPGRSCEAFLLIPDNLAAPVPGILALHDHGGFYYYGKEKIVQTENPLPCLQEHIKASYEGRTYADELAKMGFVVLAPDAFYFGSQRLNVGELSNQYTGELTNLEPGSDEYIRKFNIICGKQEELVAKSIFLSGSNWTGIMMHSERVALTYLCSRPEVAGRKIGCIGLSIGGFRSAFLFGLDPRIDAGVDVGWMTTFQDILGNYLWCHTWMIYVPNLSNYFDLPDVAALNAPKPFMVINCSRDELFPMNGMRAAEAKLKKIYSTIGKPDNFVCEFYDVPHSFPIQAQNSAIKWFEKCMK